MSSNVIICGAGLCGTLLAIRLADRGHRVTLLEKRDDPRKGAIVAGRSINLALSDRGLAALELINLREKALAISIPMLGRMIHAKDGSTTRLLPYSGRSEEFIQSISRHGLNSLLLDAATSHDGIEVHFGMDVKRADVLNANVAGTKSTTGEKIDFAGDILIGTDGAGSDIRQGFINMGSTIRFNYSQEFLDHGYKELEIPAGPGGSWLIEKNALHIWPRHNYMLIALPNLNGSFTVTLFLPFDGAPGFDQLHDKKDILDFFTTQFPDVVPLMPHLVPDFIAHPTGALGTIRCSPWFTSRSLLMGDAAHAVVPFYGQGMNCAMEDVRILDQCLDEHDEAWSSAFEAYQQLRKKNTDAIADLALENYTEMRDHVDNPNFIAKRQIEMQLEKKYPEYASKYNLVTFREDIGYAEAKKRGHAQDDWLLEYCAEHDVSQMSDSELEKIYLKLRET
ncbi:MAG TPA: NAD(P)/FAD-dependent oxidoreductase [Saprospiraceae bacterium]|nr:NAD(P)/FAD-dependent oxidoreductase [Saprospiraceae bacterium]